MVILIETYWRRVGTLSVRNKGTSSPGKSLANSILTWHLCLAAWQTFVRVCVLSYFSHIRLLDCSPPGSSVHGILQARFLQNGLPCPPLGDLPNPRDQTCVSYSPVLADGFFTTSASWEAWHTSVGVWVHFSIPEGLEGWCYLPSRVPDSLLVNTLGHPTQPTFFHFHAINPQCKFG